jgi:hypothetical protein
MLNEKVFHKYHMKSSEMLFAMALFLYILGKTLEISTLSSQEDSIVYLMKFFRYSAYFIILLKILFWDNFIKEEIWAVLLMYAVLFVITINGNDRTLVFNCLFLVAAKNMNLRSVLKISTVSLFFASGTVLLMCFAKMIPDWIYIQEERTRHSLGFIYPSYISSIFYYLAIAWFVLRKERSSIGELFIVELINGIIYYLTDSRTAFYGGALAFTLMWGLKFRKKKLQPTFFARFIYEYTVFFIAIACIIICLNYDNSNQYMSVLNRFLNNRLLMGHRALQNYQVSLFGTDITWIGYGGLGYTKKVLEATYNFVDCSYIKLLLDYGIIFYGMILCGYSWCASEALKQGDRYLAMAILLICCYSIIEPRLIEFGFNPFVLALSALIVNKLVILNPSKKLHLKTFRFIHEKNRGF